MESFEGRFEKYSKDVSDAAKNNSIKIAISRAVINTEKNIDEVMRFYPDTQDLANEVRKIKEYSIDNMDELVKKAREEMEKNHCKTYFAKDQNEVYKIVDGIVGNKKNVVKAKSITTEEISLREHLEEIGKDVIETDVGEFIVQKLNTRPMHILGPSLHVPREEVAELIEKITGKNINKDDLDGMVEEIRNILREKFMKAEVGISGANVIAADTGTIFIIENEGNARLTTGLPPVHIVIVGIEKVVPKLDDAFKVAEVTWRYSGFKAPQYVSLITGVSTTSDIEANRIFGVDGPKEIHVIFLDNHRKEMAKTIFKEALYCLRCGRCMFECPVFQIIAGHFGQKYMGGIGAIWDTFILGKDAAAPEAFTCAVCGKCYLVCPMKINTPELIPNLRAYIRGEEYGF
ncbi:MAG: LUD domain-containing protein [Caldisphaera sp.]